MRDSFVSHFVWEYEQSSQAVAARLDYLDELRAHNQRRLIIPRFAIMRRANTASSTGGKLASEATLDGEMSSSALLMASSLKPKRTLTTAKIASPKGMPIFTRHIGQVFLLKSSIICAVKS